MACAGAIDAETARDVPSTFQIGVNVDATNIVVAAIPNILNIFMGKFYLSIHVYGYRVFLYMSREV
jgi:hypothetical protein